MAVIIYDREDDNETYEIDELSQRILVYLMTEGAARIDEIRNPVGANANSEVQQRIDTKMGRSGSGFITRISSDQATLDGELIERYSLTSEGERFVHSHKATLSLPTTLQDLSEKVSQLAIDVEELFSLVEEYKER
ncbi:hypothetical protein SAMN05421858_4303 [Haladaptatus litoreus]|uniref:Uncharacterized protein n=1 Tax=Haladaptatus litoreus TaxID=553468 RepID=A0A1N7EJC3_9EURY|nr:hypothetical protein [Haladaptatus litoreus]SIR88167.1 hypothetical protein SAMN05421858_4303 [Haladaptatus litoreus]